MTFTRKGTFYVNQTNLLMEKLVFKGPRLVSQRSSFLLEKEILFEGHTFLPNESEIKIQFLVQKKAPVNCHIQDQKDTQFQVKPQNQTKETFKNQRYFLQFFKFGMTFLLKQSILFAMIFFPGFPTKVFSETPPIPFPGAPYAEFVMI